MIREDLRKYIGEAMDKWCDDNNITENIEERFKKAFLETVDDGLDIFYDYILQVVKSRDMDLHFVVDNYRLCMLCKEIVKGE